MTKTVEEVRRELFEAKFPTPKGHDGNPLASWIDDEKLYRADVYPGEPHDDYGALWEGFNAALDAVEIQLPGAHEAMKAVFDYQHGPSNKNVTGTTNWAANVGMVVVDDCRAAIEQTGLGMRIK